MAGSIVATALACHTPRLAQAAGLPPFLHDVAEGGRRMGARLRDLRPDVVVVQSAHWLTTFHWYVTCQQQHRGCCVATEAPDLIPGLPYERPGHPAFAEAIATAAEAHEIPVGRNASPHFVWDYGALVPLLHLDADGVLPVVLLSTCMAADLDECRRLGAALHAAAVASALRVAFVASGALSHELVRGPARWPSEAHQALDRRFMDGLTGGDVPGLQAWLPEFARSAVAEVGGRHLATLLGVMEGGGGPWAGDVYGYGPSSGSGNANVLLEPTP